MASDTRGREGFPLSPFEILDAAERRAKIRLWLAIANLIGLLASFVVGLDGHWQGAYWLLLLVFVGVGKYDDLRRQRP